MRPSDAVLIEICNSVFGSAILGILVSGSFVTDTYDPSSSDIDLISVAEIPRSDRFMGVTQGIRVDVYTGIQADLERAFRRDARDNNSVLYSFVRGRSLYDPQGIISHLKNLAAQIWHDGPASPDMEEEKNLQIAMQKAFAPLVLQNGARWHIFILQSYCSNVFSSTVEYTNFGPQQCGKC